MMEHDGEDTIGRLLDDIDEASRVPAKRRGAVLKTTVSKLASAVYANGLLPEELTQLLNLITHPSHLDQGTLASLIHSLYPAAGVSAEDVLSVVGCLGHGKLKPALYIQSHLLQWLILVYRVLEAQNVLVQAYAVLFNLLDTAALRPQLCHVLALITRRKHVQPFRIQSM
jgi:centromere protein I